jgi:hypothetical protein
LVLPQHTPSHVAGASLAWRQLVLVFLAAAAGGGVALVSLSEGAVGGPWLFRLFVSALLVVITGALSWRIWRCPHCGSHLGAKTFVKQCPQCGTKPGSAGEVPPDGARP